jgi:hypothetical protein
MKQKPLLLILLFGLSCFPLGCASNQGSGPGQLATRAIEIRYLEADYATAFKAATHAFFALGYTIKHSDRPSGILVGSNETSDGSAKFGWMLLLGVAGALMDTDTNQEITLLLDKGKDDKRTTLRIQMLINGKAQVDPTTVDRIWIVTQREAMVIKGVKVPEDIEKKYNDLQKQDQAETPIEED